VELRDILDRFDASLPLEEAFTIPGSWYTDPRVADLEKRAVFGNTWQALGRADQVAEPGQYITGEIAGEPIVVVRGHDGVLRGFFNVCRHHAAAVMTECAGKADRLRCPYHGWTYGLDGRLKSVTELGGVRRFELADNGLVPLSVATWEKLVFVHLDAKAPPLESFLGKRFMDEVSALRLGPLQFLERRSWILNCNWKVFVDNYLDGGYHVPFLHRGLNSVLSFQEYTIDCYDRVCLQASPIDGSAGEAMTASVRKGQAFYYWLYPNLMLNWYEGYLDTNLVVPRGIDKVEVIFDFYFADQPEAEKRKSMDVSERIQDEDHAICESVQRGLSSRAYGAGRLSARREGGENLFHKLLAEGLRAGFTSSA
jgi:choline monooxygenase